MKWRQRVSRLGLLWLSIALLLAVMGAILSLLNSDTHNVYREIAIYLEPTAIVMAAATGLVNLTQIRRGRSLADRK